MVYKDNSSANGGVVDHAEANGDVVSPCKKKEESEESGKNTKTENNVSDFVFGNGDNSPLFKNSTGFLPLIRNNSMDVSFKAELEASRKCNARNISKRKKLPAYKKKGLIVKLVAENPVVLIIGGTGCGKTTQVPQYLLDDYIYKGKGSLCKIVCTQPRKLSAVGVANRVAEERGESCGRNQSVGYHIRLDNNSPRDCGSILYCTTGMLTKYLHTDPHLLSYSHVIIDEIHERTVETDFLITILKDLLEQRPDLKLILMSATMNVESFSKYFNNCPIIEIHGRMYPIQKYMLEDVIEMTSFRPRRTVNRCDKNEEVQQFLKEIRLKYSYWTVEALRSWDENRINFELVARLLDYICRYEEGGAVLIFLPGMDDIECLYYFLIQHSIFSWPYCLIYMLHSMIPIEEQLQIHEPPPRRTRKVILATNIAETSITVNDVAFVIDCGKMKLNAFDGKRNLSSLQLCWISKANARQRRGRAGRTRPGKCYHLFSSYRESKLEDFPPPEICRVSLQRICLAIKYLNLGDIRSLLSKTMDPPPEENISASVKLLQSLNALDKHEELTSLGSTLAQLPLDPHLGKMLLTGIAFSCLDPMLTIVAMLEHKDPFYVPNDSGSKKKAKIAKMAFADGSESDHIMFAKAFDEWEKSDSKRRFCEENFLSIGVLNIIKRLRWQFVGTLYNLGFLVSENPKDLAANKNSENKTLVKASVCAGLYPNIATVKPESILKSKIVCSTSTGKAFIHCKSIQCINPPTSRLLVYYNKLKTSKTFLYDTTMISPSMLHAITKVIASNDHSVEKAEDEEFLVELQSSGAVQKVLSSLERKLTSLKLSG